MKVMGSAILFFEAIVLGLSIPISSSYLPNFKVADALGNVLAHAALHLGNWRRATRSARCNYNWSCSSESS